MTEAERQMMNAIHMRGLVLTLSDDAQKIVLDRIKAIMEDAHDEQ